MVNGVYKPTNITGGHHLIVNISKPMLRYAKLGNTQPLILLDPSSLWQWILLASIDRA